MSVEVTKLASGLTVVTDEMPGINTAAVSVMFGAGSRSETGAEHGLAHLLEHMAFKGTTRRNAQKIVEEIEEVGGDLNASTSSEQTSYEARVLGADVPLALDILADILTDPTLPDDELKREKSVILQEIGAAEDSPDDLVYELAHETGFSGQPIGRAILGTPASVMALDNGAISGFLGRHYTASNCVVSISGAVKHREAVNRSEQLFGGLAVGTAPDLADATWTGGEVRKVRDLEQAHLVLAFPGQSFGHPDSLALHVFSNLLGGGMSSRLFQEIREKRGLVYSVHAFHWPFSDTGVFGVYAGTGEDDLDELMPVMLDELSAAVRNASEEELNRAKAQMRMALEMAREQPAIRAERVAKQILMIGRHVPTAEILARLDAITVADVRRVGQEAISAMPAFAAIGPVKRLMPFERISERLGKPLAA